MPTMIQTKSGTVTGLWGKAMIRGADGKMRPLQVGDYVVKGDVILTSQDGIVQLTPDEVPVARKPIDDEIDPPAAGVGGGALSEALRVGRISEGVTDASFNQTSFFETQRIAATTLGENSLIPSAFPAALSVPEDSLLPVRLAGQDPDGTVQSVTITRLPTGGLLFKQDGTPLRFPDGQDRLTLTPEEAAVLVFVPAPNFNGDPGSIVFFVTDNSGNASSSATVTISVTPVNDPPVPGTVLSGPDQTPGPDPDPTLIAGTPNYRATTDEDTAVTGAVRATDVDRDALTFTATSTPSNGTVTVNPDGTWRYVPNPNYNGPDQFTVTVSDGNGGTATSTIFINVTPVNDAPTGRDASRNTVQGSSYTIDANDLGFSDVDAGDSLRGVRIDTVPTNGTLQLNGQPVAAGAVITLAQLDAGELKFVPDSGESGTPYGSFTFSVQDQSGAFDTTPNTFTLKVAPLSNTPAVADDVASTPEGTPVTIDVLANDSDADPGDTLTISEVEGQPITAGGTPVQITDADGNPIGTVTLTPDNKLVFTPEPDYNGPASFTYTATDGLTPVSGTVDVSVTPVNDPPVANPDVTNTPVGQPVTIPVRANDIDPDGDPLTITQVDGRPISTGTPVTLTNPQTGNPVGSVVLTPNGELVFTPAPGLTGPVEFPYTVTDGSGTQSSSTVRINVGEANDPPVARPDAITTTEDNALVVSAANGVIAGRGAGSADTDPDGDSLSVAAVAFGSVVGTVGAPLAGAWGSLVLRPDGSYTYRPSAAARALDDGETQTDVFTYTVTDPNGLRATTTLTITVTGLNDAPVAVNDSAKTPEGAPVTIPVLANDRDPDGDPLTVTQVDGKPISTTTPVELVDTFTNTPIGTVTLTPTGALIFTPAPGYNGPVDFPYTVSDGTTTDTGTVSVIVDSSNDPPVANPDIVSGPQDTLLSFDPRANDADPEKDPLTITEINGQPISATTPVRLPEGLLSLNPDGTLTFQPNPGFTGPLTFDYTVTDGSLPDTSTVTININNTNDPPAGQDTTRTTPEDTAYTIEANDFGFTDPDAGDTLSGVRIDSLPGNGSLQLNGAPVAAGTVVTIAQINAGQLTFVPDPDENGSPYASFSFSVQDSSGRFDPTTNTFVLNVSPLSDTPVVADDRATTDEDTPVTIDVLANDTDADVGDVLTVVAVNDQPISPTSGPVAITAPDGTPLGQVRLTPDNKLVFTPAPNYNGPVNFTYTASDGLTPVKGNVDVQVNPVNDPPVAAPDVINTPEDQPISIPVLRNDTDPDNDPLTVTSIAGQPAVVGTPIPVNGPNGTPAGTVTLAADGTLRFDPVPNFNGPVTFPYTITDSKGAPGGSTVTVNVGGVNDAPVAAPDTGTTNEDTTLQVTAANGVILGAPGRDTDPENDTMSVTGINFGATTGTVGTPLAGAWGRLELRADGSYTYTPSDAAQALDDGESRVDVFTYTVSDGGGLSSTTTLTITVTGRNDAPVALDDRAVTPEDTPVTVAVLANDTDPDGDPLTITQVGNRPISVGSPVALTDPNTGAPIGEVALTPQGTLVFTPAPGFNGPISFPYTVSDGTTTDTATVNLTVDSVNDPPVANPDIASGPEDTVLTFDPRSNDADPEKDPLTITEINGQPISLTTPVTLPEGVLSLNPDGTLSFDPNPNFNGPVRFAYTVSDGEFSDTSTVTITITASNDPPDGKDATRSTAQGLPYTVEANDLGFTDPDTGDSLRAVRIDTLPTNGTLQLDGRPVTAGTLVTAAQLAAGALKFVPDAGESGVPYGSFTFSVQDQSGAFDPTPNTFTLKVDPLSNTPAVADDLATTPEDTPVTIDVLANDSDADAGDVLRIIEVNGRPITVGGTPVPVTDAAGNPVGSVTLTPDGKLVFTPVADYNGPASFTYTATDGLTPVTGTVDVTVTPANDPPQANPDVTNTPAGQPVTIPVLSNDRDPDGDTLTVTQVDGKPITPTTPVTLTSPNGTPLGTVALTPTGELIFTPAQGVTGPVSFPYTVTDPSGTPSTAGVTVNVGAVNAAPTATPDTNTTSEDSTLVVGATNGVISGVPGRTPSGADTDPNGDTLTVRAVSFGANTGIVGAPLAGAWGSLVLRPDGSYTYRPSEAAQALDDGQSRTDVFTYTVTDPRGLSATTTLTITVTGVNDGPVAVDDSAKTPEGQPVTIPVLANDRDPEGDPLTVTAVDGKPISVGNPVTLTDPVTGDPIGTVALTPTGALVFTPAPGFNGPVDFPYTVSDGTTTDTGTVSVIVDSRNDPPNANPDLITSPQGTLVTFDPRANDADPEKDPLTITEINGRPISEGNPVTLPEGVLSLNPDGTLSFQPNPGFNGPLTFGYTVSDGSLNDQSTVTINVVGNLPEGKDVAETTPEDVPYTLTVANFGFADADPGDTLRAVRIDSLPTNGTLQLNGTTLTAPTLVTAAQVASGALKYVPDANENGTPYGSFTFSVQDQSGAFDPTPNTFVLNVEPVSDTPAAGNDTATTREDTPVTIDVLLNDSDNDPEDKLTIIAVNNTPVTVNGPGVPVIGAGNVPIGTVTLVIAGGKEQLTFTPVKDYTGPAIFSYTVTDGLTPVNATVSVTVTPVNDAPVANPDTVNTEEDTTVVITVLRNDTDVDNDRSELRITSFTQTTNGTLTLNQDGTFSYDPVPNFTGTDRFTYTIQDPAGLSSTTTVTINVGGVNDAPVARPDTDTTNEDTVLTRPVGEGVIVGRNLASADTDLDNDSLTVSGVAFKGVAGTVGQAIVGDWGTLTLNPDGSYRYVPNRAAQALDDGESRADQFSYTITDGTLSSTTTLTITVTGVNDAPVAVDDSGSTREGQPVTVAVLPNDIDVDGDPLSVTQVNGQPITLQQGVDLFDNSPSRNKIGTVTLEPSGSLTFTPVPLFNGKVEFNYTVSDGVLTDVGLVTISVDDVNDPPDAADDPLTGFEDTPLNFNPLSNDTDVDGGPLVITSVNGTPIKLGDPPIAVPNGTVQMIPGTDPGTTQLQFVPNPNFNGTVSFPYAISDGRGGTDSATITINVTSVNDLPEGKDASETTPEDVPYTLTVANFGFADADAGDTLRAVRIDSLPTNGTLQLNGTTLTAPTLVTAAQVASGALKYVPDANENGTPYGSFTFSVQDQSGAFDPTPNTFVLNVEPVSDTPAAGNDTATTREDTPVTIDVLLNDSDNDPEDKLTIIAVNNTPVTVNGPGVPVIGAGNVPIGTVTLVIAGGKEQLTFTPVKDYTGPAIFSYTVTDGLTPVNATVSVTVTPVNDAPVANPDTVNTEEDTTVVITVLRNDTDVDNDRSELRITSFTQTTNGTLTLNQDGTFSYDPVPNFTGTDRFTYTIQDPAGLSSTTTVTINVGGVNDAPVARPDTDTTNEDTVLTRPVGEGVIVGRNLASADTDLDNDSLTVSGVAFKGVAGTVGQAIVGDWGTLTLNPDGSYRYVPNRAAQALDDGESRADQFSYTITDGTLSSTTTLTITVTGVNDAPVAVDDSGSTREGQPVTVAVLPNDIDVDGDPLSVTQVNGQPITLQQGVDLFDNSPSRNKIGTVTLEPSGSLTFTPVPLFNGKVEFNYTVSDGVLTDVGLVTISVDDVNDPPDAADDPLTGFEDTPLNFNPLSNDTDVDGGPLVITSVNGTPIKLGDPPIAVPNGTVQMIPGTDPGTTQLQFVPNPNFNGTVSFPYAISDGRGGTDSATITINVTSVNDLPEGKDNTATVTEGNAYTLRVADFGFTDADANDSLKAVRIDSLPTNGTLQLNGTVLTAPTLVTSEQLAAGALRFVPDANENGSPYGSFTFSVQDQSNGFDPVPNTFTLNVIGGITVTPATVNEGDVATFTVGIPASAQPTPIKLAISTADPQFTAEDADLVQPVTPVVTYVNSTGQTITLTPDGNGNYIVPPGVTSVQVGVPTFQDQVYEGPETFGLTVTSTSPTVTNGVTGATGVGTIDDKDGPNSDLPIVGISLAPPTQVDEDGTTNLVYTVSITNGKTSEFPTIVNFTLGGTATEGSDYAPVVRSVTIPAGATSVSFPVDPTDDPVFEGPETVIATLTSASTNGLTVPLNPAATSATGTIDDSSGPGSDKPIVGITVSPPTVDEEGATNLTYTVAITNGKTSTTPTVVTFTLTGTATEGTDYATVTKTVTIPAGATSATFVVDPTDDQVFEGPETVVATITSVATSTGIALGIDPARTSATGAIDDSNGPGSDKPIVGITVAPPLVQEDGTPNLTYTVAITNGKTSTTPTVVTFTLTGTATEGTDYATVTKTVTIPAGATSATFTVDPTDDQVFEGRETVVATITGVATSGGVALGIDPALTSATGTIDDTDGPNSDKPIIGISVDPATVEEDGTPVLTYTVSITNGKTSATPTEVTFTLGGTATEGSDYAPVTKTVTIPANATSVTFTVDPTTDTVFERNETVVATLSTATTNGVTLAFDPARTAATGTIVDNDRPTQGSVPTAQEAALAVGTTPALTTEVVTGRMAGTDTGNPNFSWTLGAPTPGVIKSGGVNVVWTTSADGKTVSGSITETINGVQTVKPIATLTINNAGDYTFTLQGPIDHPPGGPATQVLPIDFTATANTGGTGAVTATVPLSINVQDDQPLQPTAPSGLTSTIANTNLLFILDLSGSMNQPSGIPGLTRLQAAVDSISRLIEKYDALGEATVRIVTFNTTASARDATGFSNVFLNLGDQAQKTALTNLLASIRNNPPPDGASTNYDAALGTAITAWAAGGKIAGAQNVSYFLSDGQPTAHSGNTSQLLNPANPNQFTIDNDFATNRDADTGIQAAEEQLWIDFLRQNNLQSYAIGIGSGIANGGPDLAPVAYDGQAQEDRNGSIVTDFAQLDSVLARTLPAPVSGNLLSTLTGNATGADAGIFVRSITIEGTTFTFTRAANGVGGTLAGTLSPGSTFDAATGVLTVNSLSTSGSKFTIDFDDGRFVFDTPQRVGTESFAYTLSDRDGDVSPASTLSIVIDNPAPAVNGDAAANNPLNGDARFNTIFGNGGDDVINGLGGNDRLFGNVGNDTLDGGSGNDELSGGAGNDVLRGGDGDDLLFGGPGNDSLTGGAGSDVFAWRFADQGGNTAATRAVDTITDFNVAPASQGGDVLDLRDLLIGESQTAAATSAQNLSRYIDIVSDGTNTSIRISTTGGFTDGNFVESASNQQITLTGVNLSTALVPGQTLTEAQIIENLLRTGKLITD